MKSLKTRRALQRIRQAVATGLAEIPGVGDGCNDSLADNLKYAAGTVTVPAAVLGVAGEATVRITTPGSFCPLQMFIVSDDLELIFVGSIKNGLEEQIVSTNIGGTATKILPATMFSIDNHCCQPTCMRCLCMPGVPFEVLLGNTDVTPEDVTVVLVGVYSDVYPLPTTPQQLAVECEPHNTKFAGFALVLQSGERQTIRIETPGRFCPTGMFIQPSNFLFGLVTGIKSGIKEQIIEGGLPLNIFTVRNQCCSLACFDCLCQPGYPLEIEFFNDNPEGPLVITGGVVGSYEDYC